MWEKATTQQERVVIKVKNKQFKLKQEKRGSAAAKDERKPTHTDD